MIHRSIDMKVNFDGNWSLNNSRLLEQPLNADSIMDSVKSNLDRSVERLKWRRIVKGIGHMSSYFLQWAIGIDVLVSVGPAKTFHTDFSLPAKPSSGLLLKAFFIVSQLRCRDSNFRFTYKYELRENTQKLWKTETRK